MILIIACMVTIGLNPFLCSLDKGSGEDVCIQSHVSFFSTCDRLKKWQLRFPYQRNERIFNDMMFFFLLASKKFLDHRSPSYLSRLILSIHFMQNKLQRAFAVHPNRRHLIVRWIPTCLSFPFSSKPVLGCLVGFNLTDRYELFDEENVLLVLQKNHPEVKIVKDSSYSHVLPDKSLKILYFEIERVNGSFFSLAERSALASNLEKQIKGGFQRLAPTVFMRRNEEEVYKTILTLSREIQSEEDLPQAWISFERQLGNEIIFLVVLVYVSPKSHFPLDQCFGSSTECTFISERLVTIRHLHDHPIEAQVFRLHLKRSLPLVRSNGSLNFYASRQKIVSLIHNAIGEFRDYNGGSLIKQRELLDDLKMRFPWAADSESELMETFFYGITPLEQQTLLMGDTLAALFQDFLDSYFRKMSPDVPYVLDTHKTDNSIFLVFQGQNASWKKVILDVVDRPDYKKCHLTYTMLEVPEGLFFHGVLPPGEISENLIMVLKSSLQKQHQRIAERQILRIGMEYALVSLDPRVGGDFLSRETLRLLFEGLTRMDENGQVKNGVAESITISADQKQYIFKLRPTQWNDGSPLKATDFEYAWKTVLSPNFKTAFAYLFYPIKNAKGAKEGRVPLEAVGISALDERTLKVDLAHPAPYFLELTAQPIYFPVHQLMDQSHPQWSYQVGHAYPCNGPFELAINDPNHQTYRFLKNFTYWDAKGVILDEILLTQINPHQALQGFQREELDWIGNPFGNWHPFYEARLEDQQISFSGASACWLVFNTLCHPFHHCKIRQALALVIDRDALIADAFLPLAPAYSLLPPHYHPQACFPRHNVDQGRHLLAEGLSELGLSKNELAPLQLIYHPGGIREDIALRLAQQLRELLGLACHSQPMHWNSIFSKMTQGDFQMSLILWTPQTHDPIITLNTFRHAQEGVNVSNWESTAFQHWLRLSDEEVNPSQRAFYLRCAEENLSNEAPAVPLFYQSSQTLVKHGFKVAHNYSSDLARSFFTGQNDNRSPGTHITS